jgi:hypothetical protein
MMSRVMYLCLIPFALTMAAAAITSNPKFGSNESSSPLLLRNRRDRQVLNVIVTLDSRGCPYIGDLDNTRKAKVGDVKC